jgi:serine/threonine protein kinase
MIISATQSCCIYPNPMEIRIEESPTRGLLPEPESVKSPTKQNLLQGLHKFFSREDGRSQSPLACSECTEGQRTESQQLGRRRDFSRIVGVGMPRLATFRRQVSEKRDRLEPAQPCSLEKRAVPAHRRQRAVSAYRPASKSALLSRTPARVSAPSLPLHTTISDPLAASNHACSPQPPSGNLNGMNTDPATKSTSPARSRSSSLVSFASRSSSDRFDERARDEKQQIDAELDTKWILNLSMKFKDKSDREKFFITFAETPNRWRRVTVSCDYRNAESDSLENDLRELHYQRDKNAQIYESLRDSLKSIQFYSTVTNLKLETEDGRLHVHVTEDVNEIIPYPPRLSVQHLLSDSTHPIREAPESQIHFISHLSGFVYKVSFQDRQYIKKEIPGPETVDEFLYEVNALHALSASESVIRLEAIVFDDARQLVKGLLISYAERGAVVDLLYDHKNEIPWVDRCRWARQAIQGLSEIHEEGYVQGDFTLSNIVVNSNNDAKIIDINRRGCPVGWEPPEIAKKIASNQRISMFIGQKSDLYQLGMTLWALANDEDEPERHDQPLNMDDVPDEVPEWFKEIVMNCLSPQPRTRRAAKELLRLFPPVPSSRTSDHALHKRPSTTSRGSSQSRDARPVIRYIQPNAAVDLHDLARLGRPRRRRASRTGSDEGVYLIDPPSSSHRFDSMGSFVGIRTGTDRPSRLDSAAGTALQQGQFAEIHGDLNQHGESPPRNTYILPGRESRCDGATFGSTATPVSQPVGSVERQTAAEDRDWVPEIQHDVEHGASDADFELPNPHQSIRYARVPSITSDSTPRNPGPAIISSAVSMSPPLTENIATADLAGLGGHPALEEYSPHEPMRTPDALSWQYYDTPSTDTGTFSTAHESYSPNLIALSSMNPSENDLAVDTLDSSQALDSSTPNTMPTSTMTNTEEETALPGVP